jgi:hypothetical protein
MSEVKKVFITVKTYPTLSAKYDELVCTAGVLEDGSWIRIYPVPFRKLDYQNQYSKYQWMELPLEKNTSDPRPESFRLTDIDRIKLLEKVGTANDWEERRKFILGSKIYTNLANLVQKAKDNELSLAVFKPKQIINFKYESVDKEWPKEKLEKIEQKSMQPSLFDNPQERKYIFSVVKKLPYKFSYKIKDDDGKESTMMIEDWEIGALYWNCLKDSDGDEPVAIEKVKEKYMDTFLNNKDLYLFLGTTRQYHLMAPNPFLIIGVFYPPIQTQPTLF